MAKNVRQTTRYDLELEIEFSEEGAWIGASTRNLSIGGAYVVSTAQPAFGARLKLRFRVPSQAEWVEVGGTVRWTDPEGFGVQFDGLRARDVWALGKHFDARSKIQTP